MSEEKNARRRPRLGTIVCIILIVLLLPVLAFNVTMVVKGMLDEKNPPSVFGVIPLAVLSGSMDDGSEDCIRVGDMIFIRKTDLNELKVGDVITFSIGEDYITHRILEVRSENGRLVGFVTKGDANNTTDGLIPVENVYGKYFARVPHLGNFAIFLQTPAGILIFVGIPFLAYIIIDIAQRLAERRKTVPKQAEEEALDEKTLDEKDEEIKRLRALVESQKKDVEIARLRALTQALGLDPELGEQPKEESEEKLPTVSAILSENASSEETSSVFVENESSEETEAVPVESEASEEATSVSVENEASEETSSVSVESEASEENETEESAPAEDSSCEETEKS